MVEPDSMPFVIDYSCMLTQTYNLVSLAVAVVVFITTIFGNLLILISICKYPTRFKGSIYIFIGNLAAADLLLGIWMLLFIFEEIIPEVKQNWYFCMIKTLGIILSYSCSSICLLGLSFDRFMSVYFPLMHLVQTIRKKFFISVLAAIWLISVMGICGPVFLGLLNEQERTFICRIGALTPGHFDFISSILMTVIVVPSFVFYGLVIWKITTKKIPGQSSGRKHSSKTTISLLVNVLFVVCWLPFILFSFIEHIWPTSPVAQKSACTKAYLAKLAFINSSLNWMVYGLANNKFRMTFKSLLWSKCSLFISQPAQQTDRRAIAVVNEISHSIDSHPNVVTGGEVQTDNTQRVVISNTLLGTTYVNSSSPCIHVYSDTSHDARDVFNDTSCKIRDVKNVNAPASCQKPESSRM